MNSFRRINNRTLLGLSLLLSLALLCAQGVRMHVHELDSSHSHLIDKTDGHENLSKAHFAHDTSHSEGHDNVVSEVDISPAGLLKNLYNNISVIAIFALFITLFWFVSAPQLMQYQRERKPIVHRYYAFSPPLRAPPG